MLYRILSLLFFVTIFCSTTCHADEYIIEFSSEAETSLFLEKNKDMISDIRHTYHSDIFTGAAVKFNNQQFVQQLSHLNIWPIHHRIRQQAPFKNHHDDSNDDTRTFVPQDKVVYHGSTYILFI